MIKSYLKLALASVMLLGGCAAVQSAPVFASNSPSVVVGHGKDVEWKCSPTESTDVDQLIDCRFHKFTSTKATAQSCVTLHYVSTVTNADVVSSPAVCSDPLTDDEFTNHIVAFQRQDHALLTISCPTNGCRLVVHEEAIPASSSK